MKTYVFRDDTTIQLADSIRESDQKIWAKITKGNTFVDGSMVEMQTAIQKRNMGEESYIVPNFDLSAYSSIGNMYPTLIH